MAARSTEHDTPRRRPLIYVASLADHLNGRHHGVWIAADRDPTAITATIRAMLAASTEPDAQDWAVHDHEGFGRERIGSGDDVEAIDAKARAAVHSREGARAVRRARRG